MYGYLDFGIGHGVNLPKQAISQICAKLLIKYHLFGYYDKTLKNKNLKTQHSTLARKKCDKYIESNVSIVNDKKCYCSW